MSLDCRRLARLFRSTVDNFVTSFEDPERLLDRVVVEMQDDIIRLRQVCPPVLLFFMAKAHAQIVQ